MNVGWGPTGSAESSRSLSKGKRVLAVGRAQSSKPESLWGEAACAALCWTRWEGREAEARPPICCLPDSGRPRALTQAMPLLSRGLWHRPWGCPCLSTSACPLSLGSGRTQRVGTGSCVRTGSCPPCPYSLKHCRVHPGPCTTDTQQQVVCPLQSQGSDLYGGRVQTASAAL